MLDPASQAYLAALKRGDQADADRLAAVLDTATLLQQQLANRPDRIRAEALRLAALGVAVFPIRPRGKTPLTRHGFKDATTDPTQVAAWWSQWPDANLGLPTGIKFDVVDIDGEQGLLTMYSGAEPMAEEFDVFAMARTSRNGGRHLYVPVSGRGNKASAYPGVDYRGEGGYVVAPPSIGGNGRQYVWVRKLLAKALHRASR